MHAEPSARDQRAGIGKTCSAKPQARSRGITVYGQGIQRIAAAQRIAPIAERPRSSSQLAVPISSKTPTAIITANVSESGRWKYPTPGSQAAARIAIAKN